MTIYYCKHELGAMLTCIYLAWSSRKGQENIKLQYEPVNQYDLFVEYIHVEEDPVLAQRVVDAVNTKISPSFYYELAYTAMSCVQDALDNMYRVMILGFAYGANALNMMQYRDIMRNREIRKSLGTEICHFTDFIRFKQSGSGPLVAYIEPKNRILPALAPHFMDRMPSENWTIIDINHSIAVVHPSDEYYYFRELTDEELERLKRSEAERDSFIDLWKVFFNAIAIEERRNEKCQKSHYPLWMRKHAVEFMQSE